MGKEFMISQKFKNVRNMNMGDKQNGDFNNFSNFKWYVGLQRSRYLKLFLCVIPPHKTGHELQAEFEYIITSDCGKVLSTSGKMRIFKTGQCEFEGHPEKIAWERIINDYLDDNGNLEVNVRVKILGMNEEKSRKVLRSFEDKQFSDVALVIDEQKFHVSKLFLSSQSPYFANLFSRNSGKSEIKLSTSNPQNLQFFLELLYGEPGPDEETVEGILSIADMYNTPTIIKKCEEYLLEKSYKPLKEKLQMAGKYKLEELRKRCMTRIQSVSDVKSVAVEDPVEMDHDLLADLFQKILSLV
ncbi:hypothetical protein L3Y34_019195 [Caenorhabditis briggsae]|uniref:BTB domain-containing protein n=2 Tax=Caenorhabditis briggsae TaxID=6238 RepID=A0AAE9IWE4_CAEBR|nr:hypothetical protein L3Y34_019195 [Caenorhabditis briggsae]